MAKYGKNNFTLDILEDSAENYNEREAYWINKLGTVVPNGYNMTPGGEGYPHRNGSDCYQAKLSIEQVTEVVDLLRNTSMSQTEIGEIYGVKQEVISNINVGKTYYNDEIEYPIRNKDDSVHQQIVHLLSNTTLSFNQIAKSVGSTKPIVNAIDKGKIFYNPLASYPIRKVPNDNRVFDDALLAKVIKLLEDSDLTTAQIGEMFGVKRMAIEQINNGKTYYNPSIDYPIRKSPRSHVSLNTQQVEEVVDLLKNTNLSIRKIAKRYNVQHGTITGINNGTTKRYRVHDIEYPIRKRY